MSEAAASTISSSSSNPLLRVPIAQRVLCFSATKLDQVVVLSRVTSIWNDTTEGKYGGAVIQSFLSTRGSSDCYSRSVLLRLMFDAILLLPSYPWIFMHLVDIFLQHHKGGEASIGKRIKSVAGFPTILHAICYRHSTLTPPQREGRLLQLRYLFAAGARPDVQLPMAAPVQQFVRTSRNNSRKINAKLPRLIWNSPWSWQEKQNAVQIAIDGDADYAFLMELFRAPGARHAGGRTQQYGRRLSTLQVAALAARPHAMRAVIDSGIAAKLVPAEQGEDAALCIAAARVAAGFSASIPSGGRYSGWIATWNAKFNKMQLCARANASVGCCESFALLLELLPLYWPAASVIDRAMRFLLSKELSAASHGVFVDQEICFLKETHAEFRQILHNKPYAPDKGDFDRVLQKFVGKMPSEAAVASLPVFNTKKGVCVPEEVAAAMKRSQEELTK